jgi:hypothetical protein
MSVKIFYYTECDKKPFENLAEYIKQTCESGVYLIKVWDEGRTVGLFRMK